LPLDFHDQQLSDLRLRESHLVLRQRPQPIIGRAEWEVGRNCISDIHGFVHLSEQVPLLQMLTWIEREALRLSISEVISCSRLRNLPFQPVHFALIQVCSSTIPVLKPTKPLANLAVDVSPLPGRNRRRIGPIIGSLCHAREFHRTVVTM
jgi:hypothetical protein